MAKIGFKYKNSLVLENERVDVKCLPKGQTLKVVSLFCGCGGMDLGFQGGFSLFSAEAKKRFAKNPFEVIWANDWFSESVETYRNHFGNHVVHGDINKIDSKDIPNCDIVIGGFPCQDFSISGKMGGLNEKRGQLYLQMLRVVRAKKPMAFVAENVKNILNPSLVDTKRKQTAIKTICEDFASAGYVISINNLYAPDYGIPQKRERVFIVGIRKDIAATFRFPATHHPLMSSKEALDDLWGKESDISIPNHSQMSLAKFKPPRKNGNQGNYQLKADQPSPVMRAEHHMNIQAHYRTLKPNDPLNRDFWRRLTVREAARLQCFPDDFFFIGTKSQAYKQVGNAVPPVLGWYIARALYKALNTKV